MEVNEELHCAFNNKLLDLIAEYGHENMPIYEIGYSCIRIASNLIFFAAPNEAVAMKTIIASVEDGVKEGRDLLKEKVE
jgi:hypothetical protein